MNILFCFSLIAILIAQSTGEEDTSCDKPNVKMNQMQPNGKCTRCYCQNGKWNCLLVISSIFCGDQMLPRVMDTKVLKKKQLDEASDEWEVPDEFTIKKEIHVLD